MKGSRLLYFSYIYLQCEFALPKLSKTQIKLDKKTRQEVLRAYCPNMNTVAHLVRLTQGQTQEDYVSSESIFPSFPSKVVPNFRAAKLVTINLKLGNLLL